MKKRRSEPSPSFWAISVPKDSINESEHFFLVKKWIKVYNEGSFFDNPVKGGCLNMCEKSSLCPFFKKSMPNQPANTDELIKKFCEGNSLNCARAMVYDALGDTKVPGDLLPEDKPGAYAAIAGG
jgi:hypothetical protein